MQLLLALSGACRDSGTQGADSKVHQGSSDDSQHGDDSTYTSDSDSTDSGTDPIDTRGPGPWKYVTTAFLRTCAIPEEGPVDCWGEGLNYDPGGSSYSTLPDFELYNPPDLPFKTIDMNLGTIEWLACGVLEDDSVACWGYDGVVAQAPTGSFSSVGAGDRSGAGLRADGHMVSWNVDGVTVSNEGDYLDVTPFGSYSCGARSTGIVSCDRGATIHDVAFTKIATDMFNVLCGLDASGSISCLPISTDYGTDTVGAYEDPPGGAFVDLCMGSGHACGLTAEGDITCWGANSSLNVPPDDYVQLDCGESQTCAVTTSGEINCWGECDHGEC